MHEREVLIEAGAQLSNIAFNLAQQVGQPLPERAAQSMKECQRAWDVAVVRYRAALASAPAAEAVAWQVRRTDIESSTWEQCTHDCYESTLATGKYLGLDKGPPCEVRALIVAGAPPASHPQAQVAATPDLDAAAKKLAECMDYPWEHMPQGGRRKMREHAEAVLAAAQGGA